MSDQTAGWPQDKLHLLVPCLLFALADDDGSLPVPAGRLETAVMQLLPPLLDGLLARRPVGGSHPAPPGQQALEREQGAEAEDPTLRSPIKLMVGTGAALRAPASPPCLS